MSAVLTGDFAKLRQGNADLRRCSKQIHAYRQAAEEWTKARAMLKIPEIPDAEEECPAESRMPRRRPIANLHSDRADEPTKKAYA